MDMEIKTANEMEGVHVASFSRLTEHKEHAQKKTF